MDWRCFSKKEECAKYAGEGISNFLIENKNVPVLVMLSGGSAFSVLENIVFEKGAITTIAMLDDRFDKTNEHNNFSNLKKTEFYGRALRSGCKFISTEVRQDDDQMILAKRYEAELESWLSRNKKGKVVALFGMGADGHTAGIFPFQEDRKFFQDMFDGNRLVASYDASGKNEFPNRITTTNTFFKRIDRGYLFVTGKEKELNLTEMEIGKKEYHELPVLFFKNVLSGEVVTDVHICY